MFDFPDSDDLTITRDEALLVANFLGDYGWPEYCESENEMITFKDVINALRTGKVINIT